MKTGTFRCWLWGHRFVKIHTTFTSNFKAVSREFMASPFCVRCGIDKPKNN